MRFATVSLLGLLLSNTAWAGPTLSETISRRKRLRVAADVVSMPWYGYDVKTGKFTGFEYEFIEKVAQNMNVSVEMVPSLWESLGDNIKTGRADIAINGIFRPTGKELEESPYSWSECYYETGLAVIHKRKKSPGITVNDMIHGKVVIFTDEKAVFTMESADIKKYAQSNEDWNFADFVRNGKVDYAVLDKPAALYLVRDSRKELDVDSEVLKTQSQGCYAIMLRKDDAAFLATLNEAVQRAFPARKEIFGHYGIN